MGLGVGGGEAADSKRHNKNETGRNAGQDIGVI